MPMPTTSTASTICAAMSSSSGERRTVIDIYADDADACAADGCLRLLLRDAARQHLSADPAAHPDRPAGAVRRDRRGAALTFEPLVQTHGDITSLGFRIGRVAYCPDVSDFPADDLAAAYSGASTCGRSTRCSTGAHPSHLSLDRGAGLDRTAEAEARRADPYARAARLRDASARNARTTSSRPMTGWHSSSRSETIEELDFKNCCTH